VRARARHCLARSLHSSALPTMPHQPSSFGTVPHGRKPRSPEPELLNASRRHLLRWQRRKECWSGISWCGVSDGRTLTLSTSLHTACALVFRIGT
jgi:hypothetical protein